MPGCAAFLAQDRRVDQEAEEPKENDGANKVAEHG
jgi:hypothetical protein